MTPQFTKFIETGALPASMGERSKILDIARREILRSLPRKQPYRVPDINLAAIRGNITSTETKISTIQ